MLFESRIDNDDEVRHANVRIARSRISPRDADSCSTPGWTASRSFGKASISLRENNDHPKVPSSGDYDYVKLCLGGVLTSDLYGRPRAAARVPERQDLNRVVVRVQTVVEVIPNAG